MNYNQKHKVLINVPPYLMGFIGVILGICIAAFTEKYGIAALIIIFSIVGAVMLYYVLKEIFG